MFWFIIDVLALRKLGLSRPFRYLLLVFLVGALIAGFIYAMVFVHAVNERNLGHVQSRHSL
jgi:hypothetical protein